MILFIVGLTIGACFGLLVGGMLCAAKNTPAMEDETWKKN